jgi:hypothetical protein
MICVAIALFGLHLGGASHPPPKSPQIQSQALRPGFTGGPSDRVGEKEGRFYGCDEFCYGVKPRSIQFFLLSLSERKSAEALQ